MKNKLKWKCILPALVAVFLLLQLTNPAHTNPPVTRDMIADTMPPPQIVTMLRTACYDCHSHETKWPWYSHVAPMSWLVVKDVNDGRASLNFSNWPYDHPDWAARRLGRVSDALDSKEMPPGKYTLIHADARLTDTERKELQDWADAAAEKFKSSAATK